MTTSFVRHFSLGATALAMVVAGNWLVAAERSKTSAKSQPAQPGEEVELFAAMKAGDIDVKYIPKNDREARVTIKNNTKKPLSVKLPEAFAGMPVLAQGGVGRAGGGRVGGNNNNNNQNQAQGGGFGGGGQGGGGFGGGGGGQGGGGGGFFNVAPEKAGEIKVAAVCLEHGKKDPRPAVPYEIRPIESFTQNAEVHELLKLFAQGQLNQRAAQAAAWHLANGMSWEQLAAKTIHRADGATESYFKAQELQLAVKISEKAVAQAKQLQPKSAGDSQALSQADRK